MRRGPFSMPLEKEFAGAGVYALFYLGASRLYAKVRSEDASWPIYVGKAVPRGGRKGGVGDGGGRALCSRLAEHSKSIEAASKLDIDDFACRYLVVTPLWITMAERFLIEHFRPVWNVCIEGFGNHDPGSGRHQGEIAWWDALHPGRAWAKKLRQTRTGKDAEDRLRAFVKSHQRRALEDVLARQSADDQLVDSENQTDTETED